MAGAGTFACTTSGVREVRYGVGIGETDEYLWLWYPTVERLRYFIGFYLRADALYCASAWDGFSIGLSGFLPDALSGRHVGQPALYGCGDGHLFRDRHPFCRYHAAVYAYIGGKVRGVTAHTVVFRHDGLFLLWEQTRWCAGHLGMYRYHNSVPVVFTLCHSLRYCLCAVSNDGTDDRLSVVAGRGIPCPQLFVGSPFRSRFGCLL